MKIKKIIISIIIFLIIILIANASNIKEFYIYQQYKKDIKNEVKSNFQIVSEVKFTEKNFDRIDLFVTNEFDEMTYLEKEKFVKNVTEEIDDFILKYRVEVFYISDTHENVFVNCNSDIYSYFAYFKKNDESYDEEDAFKESIVKKYNFDDEFLIKALKYHVDKEHLEALFNLNDAQICKNEIFYLSGIKKYELKLNFDAEKYFNSIEGIYKEKQKYLDIISVQAPFQGIWKVENSNLILLFTGDTLEYSVKVKNDKYSKYSSTEDGEYYMYYYKTTYKIENNEIILDENLYDITLTFDPIKNTIQTNKNQTYSLASREIPEYPDKTMTKEEIRKSLWGEPHKINESSNSSIDWYNETWIYYINGEKYSVTFLNFEDKPTRIGKQDKDTGLYDDW